MAYQFERPIHEGRPFYERYLREIGFAGWARVPLTCAIEELGL